MLEDKLSIAIMCIPERKELVQSMLVHLSDVRVHLIVDTERKGIWPTAKRAWQSADRDYHMVLQDDLELADNFLTHVESIISLLPDKVVCFYQTLGQRAFGHKAIEAGWHWMVSQRVSTAQAIMMPKDKVLQFLMWEAKNFPQQNETGWHKKFYDDVRIGEWQMLNEIPTYCPVPELVRHIGWVSTVVKKRRQPPTVDNFYYSCPKYVDWSIGLEEAERNLFRCEHNARALSMIRKMKTRRPRVLGHL